MMGRVYSIFAITVIILQIVFILFVQSNTTDKSTAAVPFTAFVVGTIVDYIVSQNNVFIEYAFLFFTLFNGILITHEGLNYKEYRFHETWLVYYSLFLIVSISTCFRWK